MCSSLRVLLKKCPSEAVGEKLPGTMEAARPAGDGVAKQGIKMPE